MTDSCPAAPPADLVAVLRRCPLLGGVTLEAVQTFARFAVVQTYPAGTSLFAEGAAAQQCFVLIEGSVQLTLRRPAGSPRNLGHMAAPESLGEAALFADGARQCTATATEPVRTGVMTRSNFLRLSRTHPHEAVELVMRIGRCVSARYQAVDAEVKRCLLLSDSSCPP